MNGKIFEEIDVSHREGYMRGIVDIVKLGEKQTEIKGVIK